VSPALMWPCTSTTASSSRGVKSWTTCGEAKGLLGSYLQKQTFYPDTNLLIHVRKDEQPRPGSDENPT
jgi:hypothetical protein